MYAAALIPCCLAVPLLGAALILASRRRPRLSDAWALLTPALLLLPVAALYPAAAGGAYPSWSLGEPLAGLAIAFRVEPLGWLFAAVSSLLWLPTAIYSVGYAHGKGLPRQPVFHACFAAALASAVGIAFSANLLTLFLCYELLTLTTYPLVTHQRTPEARRAGRSYLVYLLGSSMGLMLLAILWIWQLTGRLDFVPGGILAGQPETVTAPLFLLFVFGIGKAALIPVHRWLPQAMVAPTPVSALLHAVAVVKAGGFALLKIALFTFGPAQLDGSMAAELLIYIASASIVIGAVIALKCDHLKQRLAYSTISQLAYIALGAALAGSVGWVGGGLHIATHAFGKITLFFCAGAILLAGGQTRVSELSGLGRRMPLTMAAFLIGSLSIIGLPPTGGMWSKWFLLLGSLETGYYVPVAAMAISSLLSVYYLLTVPVRAFLLAPAAGANLAAVGRAPLPCRIGIAAAAGGCILLFFLPQPLYELLHGMWETAARATAGAAG